MRLLWKKVEILNVFSNIVCFQRQPEVVVKQHDDALKHLLHTKLLKSVFLSKTLNFRVGEGGGGGGKKNIVGKVKNLKKSLASSSAICACIPKY